MGQAAQNSIETILATIAATHPSELLKSMADQFEVISTMPEAEVCALFRSIDLLHKLTDNQKAKLVLEGMAEAAWSRAVELQDVWNDGHKTGPAAQLIQQYAQRKSA